MIRLFKRIALERLGNLGVTFALGNARHGEVHADLGALTGEVHAKAFEHLRVHTGRDADDVLGCVLLDLLGNLNE